MLGKQITRVGSFTMCHAVVLMVALGAAGWINPNLKDADFSAAPISTETVVSNGAGTYHVMRATLVFMFDCDKADKGADV